LFVAGAIVISGSFLVVLFLLGSLLLKSNSKNKIFIKTFYFLVILIPFVYLFFSDEIIQFGNYSNLFSYGFTWIQSGISVTENLKGLHLLFGKGLGLLGKVGIENNLISDVYFDTWIFSALPQLGFVGFFSMAISWFFWITKAFKFSSMQKEYYFSIIILIGSLGYIHQAAFLSRLMMPLIIIAVAFLASKNPRFN
jgi:hypothetical protein